MSIADSINDWINRKMIRNPDINESITECRWTTGAVLADVREKEEYDSGHIPGSVNIPLSAIRNIQLSVYCLRGRRSRKAVDILSRMGYKNARSIGGIKNYTGSKEI